MSTPPKIPTFVIHRKRREGWKSTLRGGVSAGPVTATIEAARDQAEAKARALLGSGYVTCDHHVIDDEA